VYSVTSSFCFNLAKSYSPVRPPRMSLPPGSHPECLLYAPCGTYASLGDHFQLSIVMQHFHQACGVGPFCSLESGGTRSSSWEDLTFLL
jgi:hypothetical protein